MDFWIRFVGLMLFYQATVGGPYTVIVPKWEADRFCKTDIDKHIPYIKIATGSENVIERESTWAKAEDCNPDQHCALYQIPDDSTLTIDPQFRVATDNPAPMPCLIPDFKGEHLVSNPTLHPDALGKRSSLTFTPPDGDFVAMQLDNTMIVMALRVPAPQGAGTSNIRITAHPRSGSGTDKLLVVKPGTTISILNMPRDHAVMAEDTKVTDAGELDRLNRHFFFLHKLFDLPSPDTDCNRFIPKVNSAASSCTGPRTRKTPSVSSTKALGCGPGYLAGGG